jgi:hypothetical protein
MEIPEIKETVWRGVRNNASSFHIGPATELEVL